MPVETSGFWSEGCDAAGKLQQRISGNTSERPEGYLL